MPPSQQADIDDGVLSRQLPGDQRDQAEGGRQREAQDQVRAEPILALALIEDEFERAEPDRDQDKPDVVDAQPILEEPCTLLFGAGWLADERANQQ